MPLNEEFAKASKLARKANTLRASGTRPRPAPFCLRLSKDERDKLTLEAAGTPLGTYIKEKALGNPPARFRRGGIVVEDRQALAKALALLGRSRLSNNLNQIAHAVNIGVLPVTPETEAELFATVREVRQIRNLLVSALGMKADQSS